MSIKLLSVCLVSTRASANEKFADISLYFSLYFLFFQFYSRFGAKTMGASMAQSRLKTIEKLETSGIEAPKVGGE